MRIRVLILGMVLMGAAPASAPAGEPVSRYEPQVFQAVLEVLRRETKEGTEALEALVREHAPKASRATSLEQERDVVRAFLAKVPSSHVALFSREAHDFFQRELLGRDSVTPGFFLRNHGGAFHVSDVMTGGPADGAGLLPGDHVLSIDGLPPAKSPRLDGRSDDAFLADLPSHLVLGKAGETAQLVVRRGEVQRTIRVPFAPYSSLRGDRAAARTIEHRGRRIGYARLSYMYRHHTSSFLRPLLQASMRDCEGFVLDLRGRGGSQIAMWAVMALFRGKSAVWRRPAVFLLDRETRSAKEVLADWARKRGVATLVGEQTLGATRGAALFPAGPADYLLCPRDPFAPPRGIEQVGVAPDIEVADSPRTASDPILDRGLAVLVEKIAKRPKPAEGAGSAR